MAKYKVKTCAVCGKEFIPGNGRQKLCKECVVVIRKEDSKERVAQWKKDNTGKVKQYAERYKASLRGLGFVSLNNCLKGYVSHHINYKDVIYIPKKLHDGIRHRLNTRQGMAEINTLAIRFMLKQKKRGGSVCTSPLKEVNVKWKV